MADLKQAMAAGAKQIELRAGAVTFPLVRIEPGEFDMGSPPTEEGHLVNEAPVRRIRISKPFYLGRTEVTQAQYRAVTGSSPSTFQGDSLAVDQILYRDAIEFCRKLSGLAGVTVTLPTSAQWEYACRAGTKARFYSGDLLTDLDRVAWYSASSGGTVHPVGQKQPNAWGLYDMLGNVWEYCLDFISSYDKVEIVDPVGAMHPQYGAMRGGGYLHGPEYCRCATNLVSNVRFGGAGIRIAVNLE